MIMQSNIIKYIVTFSVFITAVQSMKYDIEEESLKLYGEDLQAVVKRFRRTPEYLKILKDKYSDMSAFHQDLEYQLMYHYNNKLMEYIREMFPQGKDKNVSTSTDLTFLRDGAGPFANPYRFNPFHLYKARKSTDETEKTPVEYLDSYPLLSSVLTLQERNMFKDVGFKFAGNLIHAVIKNMGSDDLSQKSTKYAIDTHKTVPTTVEHTHDITSANDIEVTHTPELPTDETFAYKYRAPSGGSPRKTPSKFG